MTTTRSPRLGLGEFQRWENWDSIVHMSGELTTQSLYSSKLDLAFICSLANNSSKSDCYWPYWSSCNWTDSAAERALQVMLMWHCMLAVMQKMVRNCTFGFSSENAGGSWSRRSSTTILHVTCRPFWIMLPIVASL